MSQLTDTYKEFCREGITDRTDWKKLNLSLITHHSTAIEGSTLSKKETYDLLAHGTKPKNKPIEHTNMVLDHYEALQFVLQQAKARAPIDEQFIKDIAARVTKRASTATWEGDLKGEYRRTFVGIGEYVFMDPVEVPGKMQRFVRMANEDVGKVKGIEEVYKLAFEAHYHMVSIHPFRDGNGRSSRLLMNYIQAYHKKPLTLVFHKDKDPYFDAIVASYKDKSTKPIEKFMKEQAIKFFEHEIDAKREREVGQGMTFM